MHWYEESPQSISDGMASDLIARYDEQRSKSPANPRSYTFGMAMVGPAFNGRPAYYQRRADKKDIGGVRFHRGLTHDNEEIIVACAVTRDMEDIPGTYFIGAITSPREPKKN